jgi:hypothetical protein
MSKTCNACGGYVCEVCGGCIAHGECSCIEDQIYSYDELDEHYKFSATHYDNRMLYNLCPVCGDVIDKTDSFTYTNKHKIGCYINICSKCRSLFKTCFYKD